MKTFTALTALLVLGLSGPVFGQSTMDHSMMTQNTTMPTEPGQSAFATIAEIVRLLRNDPKTSWNRVNIAALRAHLVDMDAVTLRAQVTTVDSDTSAVFDITSDDPRVTGSIRRMVLAHGQTMSGIDGIDMDAQTIDNGARMTVTGPNPAMIRGLGFFGVLTLGMQHQAHHMAQASGNTPHQ